MFGIRIGASPSWFVVLFVMIYSFSGFFDSVLDVSNSVAYLVTVAAVLLFFVSLALHELGHALVARRNGIEVLGIDLWIFGGLAKLSRDSETPGEEFRIAAAGPAVTALIALICLGGVAATSHLGEAVDSYTHGDSTTPLLALLSWLGIVNLWLLAFNLLPGFPLDGGRIARAAIWRATGDRHRATRAAGRIGQGLAYLLMGFGLYLALGGGDPFAGIWLLILGWFISSGARGAIAASAFSDRIDGVTAADVMDAEPVAVPGTTTALAAQDEFFLRYRLPWFPVTDAAGRVLGLLRAELVDGALASGRPTLPVDDLLDAAADGDAHVARDTPLESLLSSEALRRLGALVVVDADGRLCGLVTLDHVRRALAAGLELRP
ncbi:site-2 protease family protein [Baekduia soli]|uniref:site-2 protease family protein n=1 Tax=Baekduia soli TaxID=496014 RepID=UPI0016527F6D|nr:site-2 protease family protein [Baekduia soli]